MKPSTPAVLLAFAVLAGGCEPEASGTSGSATTRPPFEIATEPSLEVGVLEGDPMEQFDRVVAPFLLPAGSLAVPTRGRGRPKGRRRGFGPGSPRSRSPRPCHWSRPCSWTPGGCSGSGRGTPYRHALALGGRPDGRPGSGGEWLVVDRSGALVGRVAMPPDLEPLAFGSDAIVGVRRDELDVESVRVHPLARNGRSDG